MQELGYGAFFSDQFARLARDPVLIPARVTAQSRGLYELGGCDARFGEVAPGLRRDAPENGLPAVGDWVAIEDAGERALIHYVLGRRTLLRRRAAGRDTVAQIVAANIDTCLVVTSADHDLNPRRLERYLVAILDGGAEPVIVLNKTDLVSEVVPLLQTIESVAPDVRVVAISVLEDRGLNKIRDLLAPEKTAGFVGSSGVGKSSLINALVGRESQVTGGLGQDGKGRHTTIRRELLVVPDHGVLVDTPGMREVGVITSKAGIEAAFTDVAGFAAGCRFADCLHEGEPGCEVAAAVDRDELPEDRLESFVKLHRETIAGDQRKAPIGAVAKRRWKSVHKQLRTSSKGGGKRRR